MRTLCDLEAINVVVVGEVDGISVTAATEGVGRFVTADVFVGPGEVSIAELLEVELWALWDGIYWRSRWGWRWRW